MKSHSKQFVWYKFFLFFALVVVIASPVVGGTSAITKCKVKAGKAGGQDTISFSGLLDATENDFLYANPAEVVVSIDADDMPSPLTFTFPINTDSFKNGKYNYARTENASKRFFKFDTRNGKVIFNAKKYDLTGLACPVTVTVTIGSYSTTVKLDEDIVNGPKKPCPPQLLMGVKDSLTVAKAKVKIGKKSNTDSLSVKGFFTIDGMIYDKANPLVIVVGSQTFTVPGSQIITKGAKESCSKVQSDEGPYVSVKFDFSKCTYSIAIKNASITEYGTVDFGVQLFDKALLGFANIDLGPKNWYSLEELRKYDALGSWWDYIGNYTVRGPGINDSGSGNSHVSVGNSPVWINGHSCSVVNVSSSGINMSQYWYTDSAGTHQAGWGSAGGVGDFDINIDSVMVAPTVLRMGQTHTSGGTFVGTYNINNPGIDISNFHGQATSKTKLINHEQVQVPSGLFTAAKVTLKLNLQGTMYIVIDYYGEHFEGTIRFNGVVDQTWWGVPDVGIVKIVTKMTIKISGKGIGSASVTINETDELTGYYVN